MPIPHMNTSRTNLPIPNGLLPARGHYPDLPPAYAAQLKQPDRHLLPTLQFMDIYDLAEVGWSRIKAMAGIRSMRTGRIAVMHQDEQGNPSDSLHIPAENLRIDGLSIETPMQAIFRRFGRLPGIDDPTELVFHMPETGSWTVLQTPNRPDNPKQHALAIAFVLHLEGDVFQKLFGDTTADDDLTGMYTTVQVSDIYAPAASKLDPVTRSYLHQVWGAGLNVGTQTTLLPVATPPEFPGEREIDLDIIRIS